VLNRFASRDPIDDRRFLVLAVRGMIMRIDWPIASGAAYPNIRSAAGFHERMVPWRFLLMIASSAESTSALSSSAVSRRDAGRPIWWSVTTRPSCPERHRGLRLLSHSDAPCRISEPTAHFGAGSGASTRAGAPAAAHVGRPVRVITPAPLDQQAVTNAQREKPTGLVLYQPYA
jgi:hypothetical protein